MKPMMKVMEKYPHHGWGYSHSQNHTQGFWNRDNYDILGHKSNKTIEDWRKIWEFRSDDEDQDDETYSNNTQFLMKTKEEEENYEDYNPETEPAIDPVYPYGPETEPTPPEETEPDVDPITDDSEEDTSKAEHHHHHHKRGHHCCGGTIAFIILLIVHCVFLKK